MDKHHPFAVTIRWTGNRGEGTREYTGYDRSHTIEAPGKPVLDASTAPAFRGDDTKYNPEDLLVASLSACHMLWYLHLCADAGVVVTAYHDNAEGIMVQVAGGGGHFTEVTLHPKVTVADASMIEKAIALHDGAHEKCFIASSVNFPVRHVPVAVAGG